MTNLNDPREVRKHLRKLIYGDIRVDGKDVSRMSISAAASLTKAVMYSCAAQGYSGEDTMTMLAYHALLHYEKAMDQMLEFHSMNIQPQIIVETPK